MKCFKLQGANSTTLAKICILLSLLFLYPSFGKCQADYFAELNIHKTLESKRHPYVYRINPQFRWNLSATHYKRFGINSFVKRQHNNWAAMAGVFSLYTFDNEIQNYLELRPYAGLVLQNNLFKNLDFVQTLRYELRNMFYKNTSLNLTQSRVRLHLAAIYTFLQQRASASSWQLSAETEFYMIKQKDFKERFVSSREHSINIIYRSKKLHEYVLSYRLEKFNSNFITNENIGHTLGMEFKF